MILGGWFPMAKDILGLGVWIAISFLAALIGGIASIDADVFYKQLVLPEWAPPAWVFGPVWTILYFLMGIAAWMVWRVDRFFSAWVPLSFFLVQLVLNMLWSWLFFAWHLGALSFVNILFLWIMISATLISFWRVRRFAGALLVPYLLWVSFAAVLNYVIWQLNPQIL
jgi:translocator protein